jgi:hypothetical protein
MGNVLALDPVMHNTIYDATHSTTVGDPARSSDTP